MVENEAVCCPPFQPEPWDEREVTWLDRPFVKDRVRSFLHIPLNFASVMKRNMAKIEAAGAKPEEMIVIADENSLWGADVYIDVSADVPEMREEVREELRGAVGGGITKITRPRAAYL